MAITNAIMQMRRGLEADFDPDKMRPGEWAVSTDKKYVRMCFSVGVCVRMATYDAFEKDMEQIEEILSTCETIEEAVSKINTEVSANAQAVAEYTEQAKKYRDEAKAFRDEAEQFAPEGYFKLQETVASNTAKIDTIIEKAELNIKNSTSGDNLHLTDSANSKVVEFGLYGKATQDGEPTPDNPIEITVSGSDGSVEVVSCGKNLLPNTAITTTKNGITFTVNEKDKSITVSGTATATAGLTLCSQTMAIKKGKKYIFYSESGTYNANQRCYISGLDGKTGWRESGWTYTPTEDVIVSVKVGIYIASGQTVNKTFYPMLSFDGGEYEPYTETTSTIPTPNGLCGIKVSSGGNYTDENGQQWICDEVVKYADGSGKRIQRVNRETFTIDDNWETTTVHSFPCIRVPKKSLITDYAWSGKVSNIATEMYIGDSYINFKTSLSLEEFKTAISDLTVEVLQTLSEPIITDLTAEEIAEIEKLHTFYPITNISNDADCGMAVTYLCDAKNYIDNRLALIESAMLNNI